MQRSRRWRRALGLGGAMLGLAALALGCQKEPPRPEPVMRAVRIIEVGDSLIPERQFFGIAEASRTADLSFRLGGRVIELPLAQGDSVEEGALIARLDPRTWEAEERQIASQLDSERAVLAAMRRGAREEDIARLEAALAARKAEEDQATSQFERIEAIADTGAVSQAERDRARANVEVARAATRAAESELQAARTGATTEDLEAREAIIRGLEARLDEAREKLRDATLRAPFGGRIARIMVSQFEDVTANQPIATIQNLDQIDVIIQLTERDMVVDPEVASRPEFKARTVAFAEIPVLANRRFPLRLKEFQTQADAATRTYRVILQMEQDATHPVKPGMNVVVRGKADGPRAGAVAFRLPARAVWGAPDGTPHVWVVDPKTSRVSRRAVKTGDVLGDSILIVEGLEAGERVAASAVNLLREGMEVTPMRDLGSL